MCNNFFQLNLWAVLVSTLVYFFLGALWYSPVLFSKSWMVESKVVPDQSKSLPLLLLTTFIITLFMIAVLAFFVSATGATELWQGILIGLLSGTGFSAATIGITFLYEGRTLKLFLIDAGYHVTGLAIAGAILAIWN